MVMGTNGIISEQLSADIVSLEPRIQYHVICHGS